MTYGLNILTRSMSIANRGSKNKGFAYGNAWQYHSRSDRHSKILCWGIFFDLLIRDNLISRHIHDKKTSFGINHTMRDFTHDRAKDLDLVICRRTPTSKINKNFSNFSQMVDAYGIILSIEERNLLDSLPEIPLTGVQTALVALEAKAAMTEFGKARPRIYDELNSSQVTIRGDTDSAIAAGFVLVNIADTFVSPVKNPWPLEPITIPAIINKHKQPNDALKMIEKIRQLPRRSSIGNSGFDALGLSLIKCENNGSQVELYLNDPNPQVGDFLYYENFIERIETIYSQRFVGI